MHRVSRQRTGLLATFRLLSLASAVWLAPSVPALAQGAGLPDALAAGWQGRQPCERLHEDDTMRVVRCTFPPGVGHERHFHPASFLYVVAGGRARVVDAAGTRDGDVKTGVSRFSGPVEWHEFLNIGSDTIVMLLVEPKGRP